MLQTRTKIRIARALNRPIVAARRFAGQGPIAEVERGGVRWRLDLNEGIDFAIYLGIYQQIPQRVMERWIKPGALVVDAGANIGAVCLPLLERVQAEGWVIAVEPTDYAFAKLSANAGLNGALAQRLVAVQAALSDGQAERSDKRYYSRWPLQDRTADSHAVHWGEPETASRARFLSLDALLDELRAGGRVRGPVSFMKIDVDGHEVDVLAGGRRTFTADRPAALIEIAPYAQDEVPGRFETLFGLLKDYGYRLEDAGSGEPLPLSTDAFRGLVKVGAGADVLATPA